MQTLANRMVGNFFGSIFRMATEENDHPLSNIYYDLVWKCRDCAQDTYNKWRLDNFYKRKKEYEKAK